MGTASSLRYMYVPGMGNGSSSGLSMQLLCCRLDCRYLGAACMFVVVGALNWVSVRYSVPGVLDGVIILQYTVVVVGPADLSHHFKILK